MMFFYCVGDNGEGVYSVGKHKTLSGALADWAYNSESEMSILREFLDCEPEIILASSIEVSPRVTYHFVE